MTKSIRLREFFFLTEMSYYSMFSQLSLADNHIVNMKGTGAAINLRVLDLSNNSVVEIEGSYQVSLYCVVLFSQIKPLRVQCVCNVLPFYSRAGQK